MFVFRYAELLIQQHRFEEAELLYERAMRAQLNHVDTLLSYGRCVTLVPILL